MSHTLTEFRTLIERDTDGGEMMDFLEECAQAKFNQASFDGDDADTEFSFFSSGIKSDKY